MNRRAAAAVIALVAFLFEACTAVKLTYNHADEIVRFMASDYFDLDETQQEAFKARLAEFHQWHRANELPRYAEFLKAASGRFSRGVQQGDVDWATEALRKRYRLVAGRAAERAAPILATLQPAQIEALEKRFAKNNSKHVKEWLPGDRRKRERKFFERTVERFEEWSGPLNAGQRRRVEQFVKAHPRIMEIRYAERQRWQREVVDTLKRHLQPAELAPRLAKIFTDPDSGRSQEYLRENKRYEAELAQLVLDLDRTLAPEQRERVMQRMNRYADDFRTLAGSRVAGATRPPVAAN